ncbi:hypothetical protein D3C81_1411590 [compost metagenome]
MGRGFEEHRGLAADDFHVGFFGGAGVADLGQLQHFAFGDHPGGLGNDAHHRHGAEFHHHFEGARIEEVADQHARRVAPLGIGGGAAAAQAGGVDHVVVQQGGGMQELDDRGQQAQVIVGMAQGLAGEQHQQGAQPLAAGGDDVISDLFHQGDAGRELATDDPIDGGEIVRHHAIESLGLHQRQCSSWIARHAMGQGWDCQGKPGGRLLRGFSFRTIAARTSLAHPALRNCKGVRFRPQAAMPTHSSFYKASGEQV